MASGMGCPSIGIYSYELFKFYDVKNIIRLGSAGAMNKHVHLRDIVIAMSAYNNSSYLQQFGFHGDNAPCADYELLHRAVETSKELGLPWHCGPVFTSEAFYGESSDVNALRNLNILAVEMEAAALYINAALTGKHALAICTISDNTITGEELSAEDRQNSFLDMIRLGLEIA
jgi:purine-nucleoside phosphorylase